MSADNQAIRGPTTHGSKPKTDEQSISTRLARYIMISVTEHLLNGTQCQPLAWETGSESRTRVVTAQPTNPFTGLTDVSRGTHTPTMPTHSAISTNQGDLGGTPLPVKLQPQQRGQT